MSKRKSIGVGENLLLKIYKGWDKETLNKEMFMIQDVLGLLIEMDRVDTTLVFIQNYNGTQEEKEEALKYVLSLYDNKDDVVIISWAYVSKYEFTENEYYDQEYMNEEYIKKSIEEGKKPLPYDDIIERESKLLESVGFIDFNNFVQYEFSKAYLYGNSLGKEIIEYINK